MHITTKKRNRQKQLDSKINRQRNNNNNILLFFSFFPAKVWYTSDKTRSTELHNYPSSAVGGGGWATNWQFRAEIPGFWTGKAEDTKAAGGGGWTATEGGGDEDASVWSFGSSSSAVGAGSASTVCAFALSSANASQKALCVIKLSLLQSSNRH